MKNTLRFGFVLLAFATSALFAQAAAQPADAPVQVHHHKTVKVAKHGKKKHKKGHKNHRHGA